MKLINKFDSLELFKSLDANVDSSNETLATNYRQLAKEWHPDHNTSPEAVDKFQKISMAYNILKKPENKLKYTLLSMIYNKNNFPDMESICLIRDTKGNENINIRAIKLTTITGRGITFNKNEKIYYTSFSNAYNIVKEVAKHNWTLGFLSILGFFNNLYAISKNISSIKNNDENFKLFIHNAIVYKDLNYINEAYTLMNLAKSSASKDQITYIDEFINSLESPNLIKTTKWNYTKLKQAQLMYPIILVMSLFAIILIILGNNYEIAKNNKSNLKELVRFKNGQQIFSDVAVASIFDIPVNTYDDTKLYFTTKESKAMHGADYNFDLYKIIKQGVTVRITGYTVDNKWFRVMFDNGENAFIEAKNLKQGIGTPIPYGSKITKK